MDYKFINIEDIKGGLCASDETLQNIDQIDSTAKVYNPLKIINNKIVSERWDFTYNKNIFILIPNNRIHCDYGLLNGYSIQDWLEACVNYLYFSINDDIQNLYVDAYKIAINLIDNDPNLVSLGVTLGTMVLNELLKKYNINHTFKDYIVYNISNVVSGGTNYNFRRTTERKHITFEKFVEFFVCS